MSLIARARRWPAPAAPARAIAYGDLVYTSDGIPIGNYASVPLEGTGVSLQKIAIWASIDLIASLGSELPWDVYRGPELSATRVSKPSYLEDPAGDGNGYEDWAFQLLQSWLTSGNGFGQVLARNERGDAYPTQVMWWGKNDVTVTMSEGKPQWRIQGQEIKPNEMWHRRVYPTAGALLGLSPIEHHMTTIGQGIAAARFGNQFFTDGGHPTSILRNTETEVNQSQARAVKARWMAVTSGSREPAVFGRGWEHIAVQVKPEESQFLETQRYTEAMCCRIYGPGVAELLGYNDEKSMTYANVVDRRVDFLALAQNKWLRRLERVLTAMLPRGQVGRINRDALLETSTMQRFEAWKLALEQQWMVVNEVRAREGLDPVEWGNTPTAQQAAQLAADAAAQQTEEGPSDGSAD